MRDSVKDTVCVTFPLAPTNGIATVGVWHGWGLIVQERGASLSSCEKIPPCLMGGNAKVNASWCQDGHAPAKAEPIRDNTAKNEGENP